MWSTTSTLSLFVAGSLAAHHDCNWGKYDYFLFAEDGCSSYTSHYWNYSWSFHCPENEGENGTLCMYWLSTDCDSQWYNCTDMVSTYYCDGETCDSGVTLECNDYYNSSDCTGYKDKATLYELAEVSDACVPYYDDYSISYDISEDGIFARKWYSTNCSGWSYSLFNYTDGCVDESYGYYYNYSNASGGGGYVYYTKSIEYIFGEWESTGNTDSPDSSDGTDSNDTSVSDSGSSNEDDAFKLAYGYNTFCLIVGTAIVALARN